MGLEGPSCAKLVRRRALLIFVATAVFFVLGLLEIIFTSTVFVVSIFTSYILLDFMSQNLLSYVPAKYLNVDYEEHDRIANSIYLALFGIAFVVIRSLFFDYSQTAGDGVLSTGGYYVWRSYLILILADALISHNTFMEFRRRAKNYHAALFMLVNVFVKPTILLVCYYSTPTAKSVLKIVSNLNFL